MLNKHTARQVANITVMRMYSSEETLANGELASLALTRSLEMQVICSFSLSSRYVRRPSVKLDENQFEKC